MKITQISICAATLMMVAQSNGAVILQDLYSAGAPGGAPTDLGGGTFGYEIDVTSSFSAAGHGKLVLVYSSKDEGGNGASSDFGGAPVTSVTYDGVGLQTAIYHTDDASNARVTVGIYYLDNVLTDGILRIELGDEFQSEFGFGLYAVDGLKAGVQDTGTSLGSGDNANLAAVTLTTSEGFVVSEAARNNQSFAADGSDDWETLYSYSVQSYRGLSQYQVTAAAGDYFAPIGNTGSFRRVSTAGFEAADPIPEPSSTALLGLGGLTLILRRRR